MIASRYPEDNPGRLLLALVVRNPAFERLWYRLDDEHRRAIAACAAASMAGTLPFTDRDVEDIADSTCGSADIVRAVLYGCHSVSEDVAALWSYLRSSRIQERSECVQY